MAANELLTKHDDTFDRLVRQEEFILDVTETLTQSLQESGVTKAELAKRLKRSPGFVSQVFGGGRNLTLRTISDIATVLSLRPTLKLSSVPQAAPVIDTQWKRVPQPQWMIRDKESRVPSPSVSPIQEQAAWPAAA